MEETELDGVYTFNNEDDARKIEAALNAEGVKSAYIRGRGIIGLQAAAAFSTRGLKTTVHGGLGKGMIPEVDLAREAGVDIGESGGIVTNRGMHVKRGRGHITNVYALGDCTEVVDAITHRPRLNQLASTAVTQATVIADNILSDIGEQPGLYSLANIVLVQHPTVADVGGVLMGSVGVTSEAASHAGIKTISGKATKLVKARYFPGATPLTLKLIFDAYTKKLIGAQMVGEATVAERVNELGVTIRAGITAEELRLSHRDREKASYPRNRRNRPGRCFYNEHCRRRREDRCGYGCAGSEECGGSRLWFDWTTSSSCFFEKGLEDHACKWASDTAIQLLGSRYRRIIA